jgi:hypothetical protein
MSIKKEVMNRIIGFFIWESKQRRPFQGRSVVLKLE